jgi:hypothetical protein
MEDYIYVGEYLGDEDYDFIGWEEERPDDESRFAPDTCS